MRLFVLFFLFFLNISCNEKEVSNIVPEQYNDSTIVGINGLLKVENNKIVNMHGEAISLAGNSFFWSNDNWGGERYFTKIVPPISLITEGKYNIGTGDIERRRLKEKEGKKEIQGKKEEKEENQENGKI